MAIYSQARDCEVRLTTNSGTEKNAYLILRQSGGTLDLYSTNGDIALYPGNSLAATFKSDGKVGIGTSSPSTALHVNGDGTFGSTSPTIIKANGDINFAGNYNGVLSKNSTYVYLGSTNNSVALWPNSGTNANPGLIVDNSNRVGIGVTSPSALLHVKSSGNYGAILADNSSATGGGGFVSYQNGVSKAIFGTSGYIVGDTSSDAALFAETGGNIRFYTNGSASDKARIDASGRLLIGTTTTSATCNTLLQATGGTGGTLILSRNAATPADGEDLGFISFNDSAHIYNNAVIRAQRDGGTWTATTSKPSRLVFSSTGDGASSPTERMRITSGGYLKVSNNGAYDDATSANHELRNDSATAATVIDANNNSYTGPTLYNVCTRAANSAYSLFNGASGDGSDLEFNLRGDGQAYADGSWNGGGADYAEYFEWSDLNPNAEDRRGISVVLDGNKIREAQADEDPIGVISGNPSVVGDAAWNKWSDKYLRDEFGTYIQEDYEVEDEDGNTVVQQRRKLNPAYDPDVEYVSREQRPEWDCVGLMGKLRIRKGQITGSRWIKMRDINDSVEEWLVR